MKNTLISSSCLRLSSASKFLASSSCVIIFCSSPCCSSNSSFASRNSLNCSSSFLQTTLVKVFGPHQAQTKPNIILMIKLPKGLLFQKKIKIIT